MPNDERIALLLKDPKAATSHAWVTDPVFLDLFLAYCYETCDSDPSQGEEAASIALAIAPDSCYSVQALGCLAHCDRAQGDCLAALGALRHASIVSRGCESCFADLDRRLAVVKRDLRDFGGAVACAERSMERYRVLGCPGHDLHHNGLANAYMCRGQIFFEAGRPSDAASDIGECLSLVDPKVSATLYRNAIFNLAWALHATGRRNDLIRAEKHLRTARRLFQRMSKRSQERAKLEWLTAMVRSELRKAKPYRIREMLERARRDLLFLGFVQEGAAISADMMRVAFPNRVRIREAIDGLEQDCNRFKARVPTVISDALEHVKTALDSRGFRVTEIIQAAVEGLRDACGDKMLACLVTWRPLRW